MITQSIDIMMSRPGIYVVCGAASVCMVEVADGVCHQLTLDGVRSGQLTPGGWVVQSISGILGPFVRAPAPPPTPSYFLPKQGFPGDATSKK